MKNFVLPFSLLTLLVFGCQETDFREANAKLIETSVSSLEPGTIPKDAKMYDYAFYPEKYSLKDVDKYYRNELLVNNRDDSYFDNLRMSTISMMVKQFNLLEQGDLQTIEYYANELSEIDLPLPEVVAMVMIRLQENWTTAEINQQAQFIYNKNMEYIKTNLKDPKRYLDKHGEKWGKLIAIKNPEK